MTKVFIDGSAGTTGLRIRQRLSLREDLELLSIPEQFRKDDGARKDFLNRADVAFKSQAGTIPVCQNGAGLDFSEELAKKILLEKEIEIRVELHSGTACSTAWGGDLTYDYVKINGDYRT